MITLGIDIGSTTSKAVLLKDGEKILSSSVIIATVGTDGVSQAVENVLRESKIDKGQIRYTVVTGYGRKTFPGADFQVSELTCHALGVHHVFPDARIVIDIGGQDAKVLSLNREGRMSNFAMNDKCAAGTGRFLDVMAGILKLDISDLEVEAAKGDSSGGHFKHLHGICGVRGHFAACAGHKNSGSRRRDLPVRRLAGGVAGKADRNCGTGVHERRRGKECRCAQRPGKRTRSKNCIQRKCPVDGCAWSGAVCLE